MTPPEMLNCPAPRAYTAPMAAKHTDRSTAKATELTFYAAFADCDMDAMSAVWSTENVLCIHPGAPPVTGREAILRSWSGILEAAGRPSIKVVLLSRLEHDGLAVHVVEEHITDPTDPTRTLKVLATNVYRREGDGWRIVEHHASVPPGTRREGTLQ